MGENEARRARWSANVARIRHKMPDSLSGSSTRALLYRLKQHKKKRLAALVKLLCQKRHSGISRRPEIPE
jgi:hypothetical protein